MPIWNRLMADRPGPKYLAICEGIAAAIQRGDLRPGRRLPSHRMLADRLHVSIGTVTRAYREALHRGLVAGEVGRGTFVRENPPMPLKVVDHSRIPAGTLDLYQNFPVRIPGLESRVWAETLATFRRRGDLADAVRASWSELDDRSRRTGRTWIRRTGLDAPSESIMECPGFPSALCAVLGATTEPGDVVLTPELSHPSIKLLAEQHQLKIHGLPLDRHGPDVDALEEACRELEPRLFYCAPTIHTPTAKTLPEEQRRAVAEIAERYDVLIVEDEPTVFLLPEPIPPISSFAPQRSFLLCHTWLALSLGINTTYMVVPEAWKERMSTSVAATSGITPALVSEIAAMWIESDVADRLIRARRAEMNARNAMTVEMLGERALFTHPCGHHVWVELPPPWTAELFVVRAEQCGVAVNNGEWFQVEPGPAPEAVRICIGNAPGREALRWALQTLDHLIDEPRSSSQPAL
jgi:DNA-binding transcriptional MocR family regulator